MQESLPPLDQLRAVLATARHGSFAAAARADGRDASVLSRHVTALEKRLGVRLFERSTRRVVLTEAGRRYVGEVESAFGLLQRAGRDAAGATSRIAGPLTVAAPLAFGRLHVTEFATDFLAKHPEVRLDLRYSDRHVDLVADGVDIAVRLGTLADSSLVARRVAGYRHRLYAAPEYVAAHGTPRTPAELRAHRTLTFASYRPGSAWILVRGAQHVTVRLDAVLRVDDGEALLAAARRGAGIALLADWLAEQPCREGRLVPVLDGWSSGESRAVWLVTPSRARTRASVRAFLDGIGAHLRARLARPA